MLVTLKTASPLPKHKGSGIYSILLFYTSPIPSGANPLYIMLTRLTSLLFH